MEKKVRRENSMKMVMKESAKRGRKEKISELKKGIVEKKVDWNQYLERNMEADLLFNLNWIAMSNNTNDCKIKLCRSSTGMFNLWTLNGTETGFMGDKQPITKEPAAGYHTKIHSYDLYIKRKLATVKLNEYPFHRKIDVDTIGKNYQLSV